MLSGSHTVIVLHAVCGGPLFRQAPHHVGQTPSKTVRTTLPGKRVMGECLTLQGSLQRMPFRDMLSPSNTSGILTCKDMCMCGLQAHMSAVHS